MSVNGPKLAHEFCSSKLEGFLEFLTKQRIYLKKTHLQQCKMTFLLHIFRLLAFKAFKQDHVLYGFSPGISFPKNRGFPDFQSTTKT